MACPNRGHPNVPSGSGAAAAVGLIVLDFGMT
eukprot:CAMPEP_0203723794 /NCGR_PEP_ID=MMETSP0092-20131115/6622_1 /ASSEMBLY_ACC=CAM_ASM_001090 /TAXON_ID=426623 /ORGANISM="Chaetoceros affinis, Strain CCMP159" /LENGTH=31 /DNA_ID= /DNA_START= /DNA_END= /DNA_ORIENTATION=